jgi:signal transduction histidine kinase
MMHWCLWDDILSDIKPIVDTKYDVRIRYRLLLNRYLSHQGDERILLEAYELGREALLNGMGLLDISSIHQNALKSEIMINPDGHDQSNHQILLAGRLLDEILSPFEVSRLGSQDANVALRRLYEVLEAEAKRIAHILHDESGQVLATVYLELAEIKRSVPESVIQKINKLTKLLDEVREQLRRLSHELRPLILDQLGLMPALYFLGDGVKKRSGLDLHIEGTTDGRLRPSIEIVLYRMVQEALANVIRHSHASKAEVHVWINNRTINVKVNDNGIGFETSKNAKQSFQGLGLIGIQERIIALNGNYNFSSTPGDGTTLLVSIPL